jgi:D-alanyl-D-alanine carboxypeptidase/D-alanyl-D-alanine-endopeptidase (penicillin-binding protein 4)
VSDAAIPFPTVYAKLVLDDALRRHGVDDLRRTALTHPDLALNRAPPGTPTLWTHDSVALSVTLAELWQRSDNLVAERLLEELGVAAHGMPGTRRSGIAMETSWLSSIDVDESAFAVADGSGLSAYDRISPIALVAILKHDYDGPYRGLVLDALPLAGVRGTLASSWRGTPAERRVFAKTGAVARARALAGYVLNKRHGSIIFAFFVDEWTGDDTALEALEGGLMSALVDG